MVKVRKGVFYMQDNGAARLKKFYKWGLPVYKVANKKMRSDYRKAMPLLLKQIEISNNTTVLDVGTGTGGLAGILLEYTSHITGIDFSPEMLNEARINYGHKINFMNLAAHEITQFRTASFDVVSAAFCLHDMNDEYRLNVLQQMRRVAREKVIIIELPKKINPITRFVEYLEGSFYKDFANSFENQLTSVFPKFDKIAFSITMVIYICDV